MKAPVILLFLAFVVMQCRSQQSGGAEATLENTYWRLVMVGDKKVTTPPDGREVYMQLVREGEEHKLQGHAGCNGLGGDCSVEGRNIVFRPITTRMYCDAQMEVENAFTAMLTAADSFQIHGTVLELYGAGELLGRFEAGRG